MRVELRRHPGCPNAETVRQSLDECLRELGLPDAVVDVVGDYPSPTVLVDGVDVVTGSAEQLLGRACRLDLPTRERILEALARARGCARP
ncbi:alkylmercury lyase [[Mycobacterium] burgundiense]|uniref:Alkylmercury lyase n=1 Tax=[Mycobacterium] burgundiense TaxID=3064286 RepID=A0ABM9LVD5_9MYCO|nr:alkylmercury lyase [Mycolicibacterium sp. MU0053]CAJ1505348.1 alkylmercury lyase [Mycolicibacterium sp. MU0053]